MEYSINNFNDDPWGNIFGDKKMIKILKSKRAFAPALAIPLGVLVWVVVALTGISIAGIFRFLFIDKTFLIIGAVILFFILLKSKRSGQ